MDKPTAASFTALNVEEDVSLISEERTRELQIEEAFKLFQKALNAHYDRNWELASEIYDELFKVEIFTTELVGNVPPSVSSLKYLAYKNHGQLLLDLIKLNRDHLSVSEVHNRLAQGVTEFSEAMINDAGDAEFWLKLAAVMPALNLRRLTRYALESAVSRQEKAVTIEEALSNGESLGVEDLSAISSLRNILSRIGDDLTMSRPVFEKTNNSKLNTVVQRYVQKQTETPVWLQPLIREEIALVRILASAKPRLVSLVVSTGTWSSIGKALLQVSMESASSDFPLKGISNPVVVAITLPENATTVTKELELMHGEVIDLRADSPAIDQIDANVKSTVDALRDHGSLPDAESCHNEEADPADNPNEEHALKAEMGDVLDKDNDAEVLEEEPEGDTESKQNQDSDQAEDSQSFSRRKKRRQFSEEIQGERSSKRVRAKVEEISVADDNAFFENMDRLFLQVGASFGNLNRAVTTDVNGDSDRSDLPLKEFMSSLQSWNDFHGNIFLKGDGIQNPVSNVSKLLDFATVKSLPKSNATFQDEQGFAEFSALLGAGTVYLNQACIEWIKNLLLPKDDGTEPFLQFLWPQSLAKVTKNLFAFHYDLIMSVVADAIKLAGVGIKYAALSQSYFELLLDEFIDISHRHDASGNRRDAIDQCRLKLLRWKNFCLDGLSLLESTGDFEYTKLRLRYDWASIIYEQISGASHETMRVLFEDFSDLLSSLPVKIVIALPNTPYLPELSAEGVQSQMTKLHAASMFSSIFESSDDNKERQIQILEAVLRRNEATDEHTHMNLDIVQKFVDESSLEFKLHLWSLLRQAYEDIGDKTKSFKCLLVSLQMAISGLVTDDYSLRDSEQRKLILYRSLYMSRELLARAVELTFEDSKYIAYLTDQELSSSLSCLLSLLRILHVYVIFDDGAVDGTFIRSESDSHSQSAMRFREMLVHSWCLTYFCFRRKLSQTVDSEDMEMSQLQMLSLLHEELGIREYCSAADGVFLKLLQAELLNLKSDYTENEMLQCIHCRFGLTFGNESFFPYDHKTEPGTFDRSSALELVPFIMSLALRRRQSQGLPRSDMKTALDKFCEVIGVPRRDHFGIYYNQSVIDTYLSRSLNPLLLRKSLKGINLLSMVPIDSDYARVAFIGLYFLQGQIYLTQYRSRKRTMAGRTEDLDYAIRYFKHDLVCNTNRFESWYGLAQTYDALVEDDMTWGAEKLNNSDYRKGVATTQRKALLCYLLATSLYLRHSAMDPPSSTLSTFWTDFGFELYSSTRPPLEMEAYRPEEDRHFSGSNGLYTKPSYSAMKISTGLGIALNMFRAASKNDQNEWKNYYMEAKCLAKLNMDPEEVIHCLLNAISHSKDKTNSGDPIFEPHYKLISVLFKYYHGSKIGLPAALSYVTQSHYYKAPVEPIWDSNGFYALLIDILSRLRAADKKHWHHRPTYRIATIYDLGLQDIQKAKEELSSFFALKASKGFLSIWRPEFERAGRHFVYAYKYSITYIDLLEKTNDLETLCLMSKKIRRLTTGMVHHTDAWERLCRAIVNVLRELIDVPEKFMVTSLTSIPVEEFFNRSARLEFLCTHLKPSPPLIKYLQDASDLRKLNAGLAPTADLEDIFGSIYLKLYDAIPEFEREFQQAGTSAEARILSGTVSSGEGTAESPSFRTAVPQDSKSTVPIAGIGVSDNASVEHVANTSTPTPTTTASGRTRTARVTRKELISRANALLKGIAGNEAMKDKDKDSHKGKDKGSKDNGKDKDNGKEKDSDKDMDKGIDENIKDKDKDSEKDKDSDKDKDKDMDSDKDKDCDKDKDKGIDEDVKVEPGV